MKKAISGITVLFMAVMMVSCTNGQNKTANGTVAQNVNADEFSKHMEGAQILDVRTAGECSEGIIEGAIMFDFYGDDFDANLSKLDKEKPVAVYCRSGGRSGQAMEKLSKLGFKEVYNLNGGIGAWNDSGKPTVKP